MADLFHEDRPTIPRIIAWQELNKMVPYSRVHIHRLMKAGKFPKQVKIGRNRVGWLESEVADWLNARINAR
ncbi:helix-turn-helix transcriptional regulator [Jannaschia sp. 2305UL9-9]|uniref:helix-turn-helix transcriptional regulator n=1 Tax=Jannaschia sp. 2305UL9-9 TaxID=3121638 RepID=UPI003528CDAA